MTVVKKKIVEGPSLAGMKPSTTIKKGGVLYKPHRSHARVLLCECVNPCINANKLAALQPFLLAFDEGEC